MKNSQGIINNNNNFDAKTDNRFPARRSDLKLINKKVFCCSSRPHYGNEKKRKDRQITRSYQRAEKAT